MTMHTSSPNDFRKQILVPFAEWSATWSYSIGDYVISGGIIWRSLTTNLDVTPVEGADWTAVVSGGGLPTGLTYATPCLTVGTDTDNQVEVCGSATGNPVSLTPTGDADLMFRLIPRGNAPVNISPNADTDGNVSYLEVADFDMSGTRDRAINTDLFTNSNAHIVGVGGTLAISANIGGGSGITAANAGLQGLNADVYYRGSGLADKVAAVVAIPDTGGRIDEAYGLEVHPVSAGNTTNTFYGYRLKTPLVVGGGPTTYTTVYGIKLEDVNWGGTNYAIYTGAGKVRIGQRTGTAAKAATFDSDGVLVESAAPAAGGTFTTVDGKTVTYSAAGIITSVV